MLRFACSTVPLFIHMKTQAITLLGTGEAAAPRLQSLTSAVYAISTPEAPLCIDDLFSSTGLVRLKTPAGTLESKPLDEETALHLANIQIDRINCLPEDQLTILEHRITELQMPDQDIVEGVARALCLSRCVATVSGESIPVARAVGLYEDLFAIAI